MPGTVVERYLSVRQKPIKSVTAELTDWSSPPPSEKKSSKVQINQRYISYIQKYRKVLSIQNSNFKDDQNWKDFPKD